jgi:hypothetical protein
MSRDSQPKRVRKRMPQPASLEDIEALWRKQGPDAIRLVAEVDPTAYIMAMARLVADLDDDD